LATRLRRAAASLGVKIGGGVLSPSMTMGWASFPDEGVTGDELWRMADGLLQKNKVRGRNGVAAPGGASDGREVGREGSQG
jgi:hypothetical protein